MRTDTRPWLAKSPMLNMMTPGVRADTVLGSRSSCTLSTRPLPRRNVRGKRSEGKGAHVFVQVIQGQVSDAEAVHAALDRWARELAPAATGWLGSTAGVTEDGRFIGLARFDSEE